MAMSPPRLPQPQGCTHRAVTRSPGLSQWAVPCLLGEPCSGSSGAAYPHPCGHHKGLTMQCNQTSGPGDHVSQEMVIS